MAAATSNTNAQMANQTQMEPNVTTTQGQTVSTQLANMQQAPTAPTAPPTTEDREVQPQWQQEYITGDPEFDDASPDLIDLSNESNIITIDARAIIYKKTPFEEIINAEFKTYTAPNTGIEASSDGSKSGDDDGDKNFDFGN